METLSPLTVALQKCIAAERAAIVAELRRRLPFAKTGAELAEIVDAIEAGAHMRQAVTPSERTDHGSNRHAANPAPR